MNYFFYGIIIMLFCVSCQKNNLYIAEDDPWVSHEQIPLNNPEKNSSEQDLNAQWNLITAYSFLTTEENGYIKQVGPQYVIYPFAWDKIPNADYAPSGKEVGIIIPIPNYRNIWIDHADINDDGQNEVFLKLVDAEGNQLCYVYRRNQNNNIAQQIFSIESSASINLILDEEQKIIIQTEELGATGLYVREYSYIDNSFVVTSSYVRPESAFLSNQETRSIRELTAEKQENFLMGPWQRIEENSEDISFVNFHPSEKQIIFGKKNMLEIFDWRYSTKIYSGLLLSVRNSQIEFIVNNITVVYHSNNEVLLNFTGNSVWQGTYRRMSTHDKSVSLPQSDNLSFPDLKITGQFKSSLGSEFTFDNPNFSIKQSDGSTTQGVYTIFQFNEQIILEMQFLNSHNINTTKKVYGLEFSERKEGSRLVRTLTLSPARLLIWGLETINEDDIFLDQIEFIANP